MNPYNCLPDLLKELWQEVQHTFLRCHQRDSKYEQTTNLSIVKMQTLAVPPFRVQVLTGTSCSTLRYTPLKQTNIHQKKIFLLSFDSLLHKWHLIDSFILLVFLIPSMAFWHITCPQQASLNGRYLSVACSNVTGHTKTGRKERSPVRLVDSGKSLIVCQSWACILLAISSRGGSAWPPAVTSTFNQLW